METFTSSLEASIAADKVRQTHPDKKVGYEQQPDGNYRIVITEVDDGTKRSLTMLKKRSLGFNS